MTGRKDALLRTRLSPEECRARLQRRLYSVFSRYPATEWVDQRVAGWVSVEGFSLGRRDSRSPAFSPVASGRFASTADGTLIDVRFAMARLSRAFFGFVLA